MEVLRQPADTAQQRQGLIVALNAKFPRPDVFLMDVAWVGLFAALKEKVEALRRIDLHIETRVGEILALTSKI